MKTWPKKLVTIVTEKILEDKRLVKKINTITLETNNFVNPQDVNKPKNLYESMRRDCNVFSDYTLSTQLSEYACSISD